MKQLPDHFPVCIISGPEYIHIRVGDEGEWEVKWGPIVTHLYFRVDRFNLDQAFLENKFDIPAFTVIGGGALGIPAGKSLEDALSNNNIIITPNRNTWPNIRKNKKTKFNDLIKVLANPNASPASPLIQQIIKKAIRESSINGVINEGTFCKNFLRKCFVDNLNLILMMMKGRTYPDMVNTNLPNNQMDFINHVCRHFCEIDDFTEEELEQKILEVVFEYPVLFSGKPHTVCFCKRGSTFELLKETINGEVDGKDVVFHLECSYKGHSFSFKTLNDQPIKVRTNSIYGLLVCYGDAGTTLSSCKKCRWIPARYFTEGFYFQLAYFMSYEQGNGSWYMRRLMDENGNDIPLTLEDEAFSDHLSQMVKDKRETLLPMNFLTFCERFQQVENTLIYDLESATNFGHGDNWEDKKAWIYAMLSIYFGDEQKLYYDCVQDCCERVLNERIPPVTREDIEDILWAMGDRSNKQNNDAQVDYEDIYPLVYRTYYNIKYGVPPTSQASIYDVYVKHMNVWISQYGR